MGGTAIGSAMAPVLVTTLGARGAFVATGIALPAVGLLAWTQIRKLDATALQPGPGFGFLEEISFFALLPTGVLERLSRELVPLSVEDGTNVVVEGDPGDLFYIVAEGSVEVLKGGQAIATTPAGGYFGEIALLRDVPRTATVRALGDVELYALGRDVFLEAVTGSSDAHELADTVAEKRIRNDEDV